MMMKEISLHVLDIIQNSISAQATLIVVEVEVRHQRDWMRVAVRDDGRGMDGEFLKKVVSPFTTSRTTRKVGLGIPMFKAGAEAAGGTFQLQSEPGKGTFIQAEYQISHWDRPPLGDMAETIYATVLCNEGIDFVYEYTVDDGEFRFDTREIKAALGDGIPLHTPDIAAWIKEYLTEGIDALNGGI
jgi:hypothetical protein